MIASAHVNRGYKSLCRSAPNNESFLSSGSVFLRIRDVYLRFINFFNSFNCFPFFHTLVFNVGSIFQNCPTKENFFRRLANPHPRKPQYCQKSVNQMKTNPMKRRGIPQQPNRRISLIINRILYIHTEITQAYRPRLTGSHTHNEIAPDEPGTRKKNWLNAELNRK